MRQELFDENARTTPQAALRAYAQIGEVRCEVGGFLPSVRIAYETWGELNAARDNAILICHALSGDSHAIGWWNALVGPGKAIDTDRYFVIGNNLLGGCQGSTGPSTLMEDGKRYGSRFPILTLGDIAECQHRLVRTLGIETLHAVAGGSMGGMLALEWTTRFPGSVRKAFVTASCAASNAMQIGFHETARQVILRDPKWMNGDFDETDPPAQGLAIARMLGHLTYLSAESFERKFGRRLQDKDSFGYDGSVEFQVESYLNYQADGFTKRFDAGSFMALSKAVDYFNCPSLSNSQSQYLFACFTSDWFYPPSQSQTLHEMATAAGRESRLEVIDLPFGHDAFLLDGAIQAKALEEFLGK